MLKPHLIIPALLMFTAAHAAETASLVYKTPKDVTFEITADGLSSIRSANRELAKGSWSAWNGEAWFKDSGSKKVSTKALKEKTLEVLSPDHARVRHVKDDIVCVFDYQFAGEDLTISAKIENNHADEPLNVTGFSGLTFTFDRVPSGLMYTQHITYFQAHGTKLCHPGEWARIGGSYASDDSLGVGLSPWRTGMMRTLILWDYVDWTPAKREVSPARNLIYFAVSSIPPRGSQTFDFKMRVSPERDWKFLLQPYREHFQKTFGEVQYKQDNRWIGTDYLNHSIGAIGPANPYGFHGGPRRIDTVDGMKTYCDQNIPLMKDNGSQGLIVWGQGGEDPRGEMYRPDFDILPPEVESNWATLMQRMKDAGLKLGCCTRPRDMAVKRNWKSDQIISINPDDAGHRAMLWARFKNMMDKGCTLFYLDSFGDSFEDVKLMRFLRKQMGPDVLTFCEHQCDAIFPYSGGYSETSLQAKDPVKASYRVWSGVDDWEIYRWLTPGAQLASRLYQVEGKAPEGFESAEHFFYGKHIVPLVPFTDPGRMSPLKTVQPEFVDEKGQWKKE